MTEPTVANEQRTRQIGAARALSDLYGHERPTPLVWEIHPDGSLSGRLPAGSDQPAGVIGEYMRLIDAETAEADGGVITARGTWMGHAVTVTAVVPYPDEEEAA